VAEDALTKREQEIVAELRNGGRVPTIAKTLSVSPTTVRNHLQRIFWKLGVHSQAELVEYTRAHPETLVHVLSREEIQEIADVEARYWKANERLAAEINAILEEKWGPEVLGEIVHRALPLGEDAREEWRARIALWGYQPASDSDLARRRESEMETWRSEAVIRVAKAQTDGWLRSDISPHSIIEQLFSLLVGIAMQLVADPSSKRPDLVRVIDTYVTELLSGPVAGDWHA
jgi:DNA-binding CsgD family transcriptional regulator